VHCLAITAETSSSVGHMLPASVLAASQLHCLLLLSFVLWVYAERSNLKSSHCGSADVTCSAATRVTRAARFSATAVVVLPVYAEHAISSQCMDVASQSCELQRCIACD
jgi:hypothetical protein